MKKGVPEKPTDQASNVVPFRSKSQKKVDTEALKLMRISDEIDAIILKHLETGDIEAKDLVGLMSHRLGTLMRHIEEKKSLWEICEKVLKRQADM